MLTFVLIPNGKNGRGVKTYGVKYNKIHTMKDTLISIIFTFYFCCVCAELEFYPDFRKPDPSVLKWENERSAEDYALEQFTNYLQEQQRRLEIERRIKQEPDFSYSIPRVNLEEAEFAVAPPDPRYYQETTTEDDDFLNNDFDQEEQQDQPQPVLQGHLTPQMQLQLQYQQYQQKLRQQEQQKIQQEILQHKQSHHSQPVFQPPRQERERDQQTPPEIPEYPHYKLKFEPTTSKVEKAEKEEKDEKEEDYTPKVPQTLESPKSSKPVVLKTRTEANWGLSGLSKPHGGGEWRKQDLNNIVTGYHSDQAVDIKPVSSTLQDDTAGVYIIAVVAGISAAATVGLIAFAIGWYNLQKNVKNASDVEYPAYGVTGPNKDVSPTGDRRLAQSAQMYHYQHQKQQIIAMESRAAATVRHGSMSEAESDEENEEGDYTVYECPGLAPTGEMEVKNPLFQDDPTPASQPSTKNEESSMPDQK